MEIAFDTRELRKIAESSKNMTNRFGAGPADSLMILLSELRAAESIYELVAVELAFDTDTGRVVTVYTDHGAKVVLEPNHVSVPISDAGQVVWQQVYRIRILGIEGAGR